MTRRMDSDPIPNNLTLFRRLKARLKDRPDSEHEQALVRIVIVILVALYLGGVALFGEPSPSVRHGLVILALGMIFSLLIFTAIVLNPAVSLFRRVVSMVVDMGVILNLPQFNGDFY